MVTIKTGADRELEMMTRDWLDFNNTLEENLLLEAELETENIIEVPLEIINRIGVDVISAVESELDNNFNLFNVDADQFLSIGFNDNSRYGDTVYRKGLVVGV